MAIQWPLVFYALLTGLGLGAFAFVAITECLSKAERVRMPGAITALVAIAAGGVASLFHLGHPERIFNALGNLNSGVALEMLLVGLTGLVIVVYMIVIRQGYSVQTRKIVALIGLVLSALLAIVLGSTYVLAARPAWMTWVLPLFYVVSAAVLGLFTMYVWTAARKEEATVLMRVNEASLIALAVQAVVVTAYVVYLVVTPEASPAGMLVGNLAIAFWGGVVLVGLVIPVVLTAWVRVSKQKALPALTVATAGLICVLVGGVTLRAILFLLGGRVSVL